MSSALFIYATLFTTEIQPLSTSPSHLLLLEARIKVSTQMRLGLTNPIFRPAALIISVHMDHSLQQAVDRSGCRLMSAEHTNTRPAPATNGYAKPPRNLAGRTTVFADVLWPFKISTTMPLEVMRPRKAERRNQRLVSEESAFNTQTGVENLEFERERRVLRSVVVDCSGTQ
jgi:hypothetical protein